MACRHVAGCELQERRQLLRSSPRYRRYTEDRVVHGSPHPPRLGHGHYQQTLSGQIEADETYIGSKARNMHKDKRATKITGTGGKDKTAVMGILERGKDGTSKVRTSVIPNR